MPEKAAVTAPEKPASLAMKLARIMGEMRAIEKKGHNKAQNYDFVRESDVAEKASELLSKAGVWVHQSVLSHSKEELYRTQSGLMMWLTKVEMEFYFIDGETGEQSPPRMFPGEGADTGDKGIYKAMTGAEKYFLMKSFFVSTGDDPEADEKVDKTAAATTAAEGPRVVRGRQQGVQRGGRSTRATTAQVSEIAKQARELGLDADGIVPVIGKILGQEPAEGVSIRDWLGGLTSEQAAGIITALAGMATFGKDAVDTTVDGVDDQGQTDPTPSENGDTDGFTVV